MELGPYTASNENVFVAAALGFVNVISFVSGEQLITVGSLVSVSLEFSGLQLQISTVNTAMLYFLTVTAQLLAHSLPCFYLHYLGVAWLARSYPALLTPAFDGRVGSASLFDFPAISVQTAPCREHETRFKKISFFWAERLHACSAKLLLRPLLLCCVLVMVTS